MNVHNPVKQIVDSMPCRNKSEHGLGSDATRVPESNIRDNDEMQSDLVVNI